MSIELPIQIRVEDLRYATLLGRAHNELMLYIECAAEAPSREHLIHLDECVRACHERVANLEHPHSRVRLTRGFMQTLSAAYGMLECRGIM